MTTPCISDGCGVVFKLTLASSGRWNEHVLYSFTNGSDGLIPYAGLAWDAKGNLYGSANGGDSTNCFGGGCGVLFQLQSVWGGNWKEKTIYSFAGGSDGVGPSAQLIFDSSGNLFGATETGGGVGNCDSFGGCGAVFELFSNSGSGWTEGVLYSFTGGTDGCRPIGSLVADGVGNLYGTTQYSECPNFSGSGTVFELSP
jgi:hypothetical protein